MTPWVSLEKIDLGSSRYSPGLGDDLQMLCGPGLKGSVSSGQVSGRVSAFSGRISSHFLHCQGQICPGNAASTASCRSSTYTRTCRLRGIEEETGPYGGRFMPLQDNVLGSTWKKLVAKRRTSILRRLVTL